MDEVLGAVVSNGDSDRGEFESSDVMMMMKVAMATDQLMITTTRFQV